MASPRLLFLMLAVSFPFAPTTAGEAEMSVEEAYRSIPHRRTVFDANAARMAKKERRFLREFFHLVDEATVERVEMLLWLSTNGERGREAKRYEKILKRLQALDVPRTLTEVHQLVVSAIDEQRAFFNNAQKKGKWQGEAVSRDRRVKKASANLQRAYSLLIGLFPKEDEHNKRAFFDYLCALDFI